MDYFIQKQVEKNYFLSSTTPSYSFSSSSSSSFSPFLAASSLSSLSPHLTNPDFFLPYFPLTRFQPFRSRSPDASPMPLHDPVFPSNQPLFIFSTNHFQVFFSFTFLDLYFLSSHSYSFSLFYFLCFLILPLVLIFNSSLFSFSHLPLILFLLFNLMSITAFPQRSFTPLFSFSMLCFSLLLHFK